LGLSLCWLKPYYVKPAGGLAMLIKKTTVAIRAGAWDGLAGS